MALWHYGWLWPTNGPTDHWKYTPSYGARSKLRQLPVYKILGHLLAETKTRPQTKRSSKNEGRIGHMVSPWISLRSREGRSPKDNWSIDQKKPRPYFFMKASPFSLFSKKKCLHRLAYKPMNKCAIIHPWF